VKLPVKYKHCPFLMPLFGLKEHGRNLWTEFEERFDENGGIDVGRIFKVEETPYS
jgi:hypothetical protein